MMTTIAVDPPVDYSGVMLREAHQREGQAVYRAIVAERRAVAAEAKAPQVEKP